MSTDSSLPLVSILMASYNYAHTLPEALASIFAQSYPHFELIAADDGSQDSSVAILQDWQKRYPSQMTVLQHPGGVNRGIAATCRLAMSRARGSIIAFLEADDVWEKTNLQRKVAAIAQSAGTGVVYSDFAPFGNTGASLYWHIYSLAGRIQAPKNRPFRPLRVLMKRNPAATFSNFIIRRSVLEAVPPPAEGELYYDWWVLAHAAAWSDFLFIPAKLVRWRIHRGSANFSRFDMRQWNRLGGFLERLYESLAAAGLDAKQMEFLSKAADNLAHRHDRIRSGRAGRAVLSYFSREPVDCLRFLMHIVLRNLLTH